jgi:1-deoxy-D-xylulose-5-phosphate reductoisomerase
MPCVLNAANEIIVEMFLKGVISFMDIPASISRVLDKHKSIANPELEDILEADKWARTEARLIASRVSS